jgi:hypothetical protein
MKSEHIVFVAFGLVAANLLFKVVRNRRAAGEAVIHKPLMINLPTASSLR